MDRPRPDAGKPRWALFDSVIVGWDCLVYQGCLDAWELKELPAKVE